MTHRSRDQLVRRRALSGEADRPRKNSMLDKPQGPIDGAAVPGHASAIARHAQAQQLKIEGTRSKAQPRSSTVVRNPMGGYRVIAGLGEAG